MANSRSKAFAKEIKLPVSSFPIVSGESPVAKQARCLLKEREREKTHFLFRSEVESSTRSGATRFRVVGRVSRDVSRGGRRVENQSGTGVDVETLSPCLSRREREREKKTGSQR